MSVAYPQVERRAGLGRRELMREFAGRAPVVIPGAGRRMPAVGRWSAESLLDVLGDAPVRVKRNSASEPERVEVMGYRRYVELLAEHEAEDAAPAPYLHDTLLTADHPELLGDLAGFPAELLPRWYRRDWPRLALYFLGTRGSLTPLHCDTLDTHNLYFQVAGHKRFLLVSPGDHGRCYRHGWRRSEVDAEAPDLARFPRFDAADVRECTLGPGDALYIPPRSFHQVRGLDRTISFAVDWHTRASALSGVAALVRGMPLGNVLHNGLHALGLWTGLSVTLLYPLYQRHLRRVD